MPIRRSKYQSDESLKDFYSRNEWTDASKLIANEMLNFIDSINKHFIKTELVASTSHQRLCIQDKDDERLNWVIIISNYALDEYYIEYKVPKHKSPWKDAWMRGTAKGLENALVYLLKSMDESEVWDDNEELKHLIVKYIDNTTPNS